MHLFIVSQPRIDLEPGLEHNLFLRNGKINHYIQWNPDQDLVRRIADNISVALRCKVTHLTSDKIVCTESVIHRYLNPGVL